MDWDDLRYFLAVARGGSLAAAARQLKVTHSTALRRVAALEERLGARLFDRTPNGYRLTATGRQVLVRAEEVEAAMFAIERQADGVDRALDGVVRVTTSSVMARQLTTALAEFRRRHPAIVLHVLVTEDVLSLANRQADVAIRVSAAPEPYLVGRRLMDLPFVAVASAPYLSGRREAGLAEEGLAAHDWVVLDDGGEYPITAWTSARVPAERVVLRTNSPTLVVDAVRAGLGAGLIAAATADQLPDLIRLPDGEADFGLGIWALTHADLRAVPRVRALLDFLADEMRAPTVGFPYL